jgi:hypothetical protein
MFNSAGLNPDSVRRAQARPEQFVQYRTPADPLTGVQNSAALQTAVTAIAAVIAMPFGGGMKVGDALQKGLGAAGLSPEAADYADKAFKALPRGIRNLVQDGNILPPALGAVREVPAIGPDGAAVSTWDSLGQHGIGSLINGIEQQKAEDVATLTGAGK